MISVGSVARRADSLGVFIVASRVKVQGSRYRMMTRVLADSAHPILFFAVFRELRLEIGIYERVTHTKKAPCPSKPPTKCSYVPKTGRKKQQIDRPVKLFARTGARHMNAKFSTLNARKPNDKCTINVEYTIVELYAKGQHWPVNIPCLVRSFDQLSNSPQHFINDQ